MTALLIALIWLTGELIAARIVGINKQDNKDEDES